VLLLATDRGVVPLSAEVRIQLVLQLRPQPHCTPVCHGSPMRTKLRPHAPSADPALSRWHHATFLEVALHMLFIVGPLLRWAAYL
jgi:hypothetical protein